PGDEGDGYSRRARPAGAAQIIILQLPPYPTIHNSSYIASTKPKTYMTSQSEAILEQTLIAQLVSNGYDKVVIKDEADLLLNLKSQLEKHNNKTFSDADFQQILN